MPVNLDKPHLWKADIARSVDLYNDWFLRFAPATYRETRVRTTQEVEETLDRTDNLRNIEPEVLRDNPGVLFTLRMSTAPPIARDRLVGLAGVPTNLVKRMEIKGEVPRRMGEARLMAELRKIGGLIERLADADVCPWLGENREPTEQEIYRAATVIADRLCGANADPLIRNAQEARQLGEIDRWLTARGYRKVIGAAMHVETMEAGTFAFRMNVQGFKEDGRPVNIPIDAVVMPRDRGAGELPLLIEAKSAGDFANVNKRRKEETTKIVQLRRKHGSGVRFVLFLCGYFDSGYLGYGAAEGIDWVWEHRIDDFAEFGL